jgi:ABC-type branched-subunit amino acid transport system ATPase component
VLAGFHIHRELPAWQYVIPGAAARRDRQRFLDEANELLEFVGLGARAGTRAAALPYGQQRMLEIARALATRPRLFMLDEPAAGLNAAEVDFLLKRLEQIGQRGVTVVVVEHNMDLVMNVAQRVFVMDHGEALFEGTPREVQANPQVIAAYLGGEFA